MSLYYVTGLPGSGKSTVLGELKKRGYEAHDTDEKGFAGYYNSITSERDTREVSAKERTVDWRKTHVWKLPREKVLELKKQAVSSIIFLCGVTANDQDDFWHDFDGVFALCAPPEVIKQRVLSRTDKSDFGKNLHELANLMSWAEYAEKQYRDLGATIINADQPANQVVDEILSKIDD